MKTSVWFGPKTYLIKMTLLVSAAILAIVVALSIAENNKTLSDVESVRRYL